VIIGAQAGPKKIEKIEKLGIKVLDEKKWEQLISGE